MNLAEATTKTLSMGGLEILDSPKRFLSCLVDLIDPDSNEARVLYQACDEALLTFFKKAHQQNTPMAYEVAAGKAANHLVTEYMLNQEVSESTAHGLAEGVAAFAGVTLPKREAPAPAAQQPTPNATMRVNTPQGAPDAAPVAAPPLQQQSYGSTSASQSMVQQPVAAPTSVASAYQPYATPAPYQQPTPPKKNSSLTALAAMFALVAVVAAAVVLAMPKGSSTSASTTTTSVATTQTTTSSTKSDSSTTTATKTETTTPKEPTEAELLGGTESDGVLSFKINGVRFEVISVDDRKRGASRATFVYNDSSESKRIEANDGHVYIYCMDPGEQGFFLVDDSFSFQDDITVTRPGGDRSPNSVLTWQDYYVSGKHKLSVIRTPPAGDTYDGYNFDDYFWFVRRNGNSVSYIYSDWVDSSGNRDTWIETGENVYTLDNISDPDGILDGDFDLYIDGVKITLRRGN